MKRTIILTLLSLACSFSNGQTRLVADFPSGSAPGQVIVQVYDGERRDTVIYVPVVDGHIPMKIPAGFKGTPEKADEAARALQDKLETEKKKAEAAANSLNEQLEAEKKKAEAAANSLNDELESQKKKADEAAQALKEQLSGQ